MTDTLVFHSLGAAPMAIGPFSHAVEAAGWVQLTGQMPTDPDDELAALPDGVEAQTRRVMENLIIVLNELGLGLDRVVSCRVYLTDLNRDYGPMNAIYGSYFEAGRLPARTCIGVTALALGALVEIDMLALRA